MESTKPYFTISKEGWGEGWKDGEIVHLSLSGIIGANIGIRLKNLLIGNLVFSKCVLCGSIISYGYPTFCNTCRKKLQEVYNEKEIFGSNEIC